MTERRRSGRSGPVVAERRRSGRSGLLARRALVAAGLLAAAAAPSPAAAQRPVSIELLDAPVAAHPLLVDLAATLPLRGRAAPRADVDVVAPCSLRDCAIRVRADRRGRWRARLHVVVPPHRTRFTVRAAYPLQAPTAKRTVTLAPPPPAPGGPELALIGDSLAQGIEPYLPEALPGWRVTVDAARSRFLWTGMAIHATMRKPPRRPVALAFSLFTNDDPRRAPDLVNSALQSLAGLPRGSCAIWATIARSRVGGVSYAAANAALEQVAEDETARGRRLVVVPWARAVKRHPEWLREDRVHATEEGYRARAALYAEAARSCGLER